MNVEVKLFGVLADTLQKPVIEISDVTDRDSLLARLKDFDPVFSSTPFAIAFNRKLANHNFILNADSEIALLPPFSGG